MLGFSRWREANGHELQGIRPPLHASALGKALLAWSDTSDDELARLDLTPETARTVTTAGALRAELTRTCERGYALNDEELVTGFRTIGVPILDRTGRAAFALGLRGPVDLMARDRIPGVAELARATAEDVHLTLFPGRP